MFIVRSTYVTRANNKIYIALPYMAMPSESKR